MQKAVPGAPAAIGTALLGLDYEARTSVAVRRRGMPRGQVLPKAPTTMAVARSWSPANKAAVRARGSRSTRPGAPARHDAAGVRAVLLRLMQPPQTVMARKHYADVAIKGSRASPLVSNVLAAPITDPGGDPPPPDRAGHGQRGMEGVGGFWLTWQAPPPMASRDFRNRAGRY